MNSYLIINGSIFSYFIITFLDFKTCNNLLFPIIIIVIRTTNINLKSLHFTDYIIIS